MLQKLIAPSLSILLLSCSAPRHAGTDLSDAQDSAQQVLVIEETPDGQVTHSWIPASNFDLSKYPSGISHGGFTGSIVRASFNRDCEEERGRCEEMCKVDCSKLQEQAEAVRFPTTDKAVDWLKRHREELLVGTVVVIAGVAFVVAVVGSGGVALVLVPAILLVSIEVPSVPYAVGVKP